MCQPARRVLPDVGGPKPERAPVPHRRLDRWRGVAHDDAHLGDSGGPDRLKTVEQDRFVCHRQQLFRHRCT